MPEATLSPSRDIRRRGFADRAPLAAAWAWLDAVPAPAGLEMVDLESAIGRVLAAGIVSHPVPPGVPRAATDGYAVRATDCDGASPYNPLLLVLREPGFATLPPGAACPVGAGWIMPSGADAVLPFDAAEPDGACVLEVLAPIAPGCGIDGHGHGLGNGLTILQHGQILLPQHVACLKALGFTTVEVRPRPRVTLFVPGPKSGLDLLSSMLSSLLARDGAVTEAVALGSAREQDLAAALSRPAGGLVLIAGRSGMGPDDVAAAAVQAAGGTLALHGLAMEPGGSAGLGMLAGSPVILLPGDPFACLAAYDMLAARLVRRLADADGVRPHSSVDSRLGRKIVSTIGVTDIIPMRVTGGVAQRIGGNSGLAGLLADGFVVVPETSEGHPAGSMVKVHLYGPARYGSENECP